MKINVEESLYEVKTTSRFNKNLKKVIKQNKDIEKLISVVEQLANNQELDLKYKNHKLINDKNFKVVVSVILSLIGYSYIKLKIMN